MNKKLLMLIGLSLFSITVSSVEVFEESYDKQGEVSFVVKQGEVTKKVTELFSKLYPKVRVVYKQDLKGYLPADIEVSGPDRSIIALEVLAGLGLSACYYENNIIEISKFKKKGICPSVKMKNNQYPDVKRLGDGVLSFTNEWFGNFNPVQYNINQAQGMNASYILNSTPPIQELDNGVVIENTPLNRVGVNPSEKLQEKAVKTGLVSFEFKSGQLLPQMVELISKLENSPTLEWKLDPNIQWRNNKKIIKPSYDEILAKVLESYDAFADIYENDVVVIRRAEGLE